MGLQPNATDMQGRVAVVTGASGGLGQAIVEALLDRGASVALLDRSLDTLRDQVARLTADGRPAIALGCDIASEPEVAAAVASVLAQWGRCDILVNNAGIQEKAQPLEDMPAEVWDRTHGVNLRGAFLCSKHFGGAMLKARAGVIVNIGSISATVPNLSAAYSVSKAGIVALTRHIAVEWGPRNIRAVTVSPGMIQTPLSEAFYADPVTRDTRVAAVATRRIGVPADIANTVAFVASDAAGYLTGQEIVVDGGFLQTSLVRMQPQADQRQAGQYGPD